MCKYPLEQNRQWSIVAKLHIDNCHEGGSPMNGSLWIQITCRPKFVVTDGAVKCVSMVLIKGQQDYLPDGSDSSHSCWNRGPCVVE